MHPLLEADAYCYSTFREAFLPLRSRMRPLLEIALGCPHRDFYTIRDAILQFVFIVKTPAAGTSKRCATLALLLPSATPRVVRTARYRCRVPTRAGKIARGS